MKTKLLGVVAALVLFTTVNAAHADVLYSWDLVAGGGFSFGITEGFIVGFQSASGSGILTTDSSGNIIAAIGSENGSYSQTACNNLGCNSVMFTSTNMITGGSGTLNDPDLFGPAITIKDGQVSDCGLTCFPMPILSLNITEVVPLPAALPLFATGLGVLGLLGWRRKRKAAAAIAA